MCSVARTRGVCFFFFVCLLVAFISMPAYGQQVFGNILGTVTGAFGIPADNTFGNYPIYSLWGPIFVQQDLSVMKRFNAFGEGRYFEIRGESFNVFNHTNLADPNNDITSPQVGQITNIFAPVATMRRFQFAVRFNF